MKKSLVSILFLCCHFLFAHNANYNHLILRHWTLAKEHKTVEGSFYMLKNGELYIEDANLSIIHFPLSSFSIEDQNYAQKRNEWIKEINDTQISTRTNQSEILPISDYKFWISLLLLTLLSVYTFTTREKRKLNYLIPFLSIGVLAFLFGFTYTTMAPQIPNTNPLFIDSAFIPFKPNVYTRWDSKYFYVESHGIPTTHAMMSGITSWQQQVPIPQCYTGNNPWSIPLNPEIASTPVPVNPQHFLRGAVAIAVNGIAIFNPYTNTGVDALVDGQLDNWGGHCGRADDYHYHIAPLHLYGYTLNTLPIAFALDGFAVYGSFEPDGSSMKPLDSNHGHFGTNGVYHYHGTTAKPYMIGNMVGKVTEDTTLQIVPQASAKPIRPAGTPLKGATIVDCIPNGTNNGYTLNYTLNGQKYAVDYTWTPSGKYTFNFISPTGTTTSTYNGFAQCSLPTSTEEKNILSDQIIIYPNPNHNILHISLSDPIRENDVKEILIFNLMGNLTYKMDRFKPDIDISNMKPGTYIVQMNLTQNQISKKLIIH